MISVLNRLLGFRETATVPSMDGVLRPNEALDRADLLASCEAPDNAVFSGGKVLFSSGDTLFSLFSGEDEPREVSRFGGEILALAAAPDGGLAVALKDNGVVIRGGPHDGKEIAGIGPGQLTAITSLAFEGSDTLVASIGSETHGVDEWQRDLLERGSTGSVWRVTLGDGAARQIAANLAYPAGVLPVGERLVISEAGRNRLIEISAAEPHKVRIVLDDLPGYPGRLSARPGGGAWLSVFAPRNQLIEFVLREDAFRRQMMRTMDKAYWIAPTLRAGKSFKEPMQVGAVKTLGVHKPWAPTRSYGLAVRLGADFAPLASLHSRADGHRHGVTSCVEHEGRLFVTCRGDDVVVGADVMENAGRGT